MTRSNPYTRLKEICRDWADKIDYRHRKVMWTYPIGKLHQLWKLDRLKERVEAADQLAMRSCWKALTKG